MSMKLYDKEQLLKDLARIYSVRDERAMDWNCNGVYVTRFDYGLSYLVCIDGRAHATSVWIDGTNPELPMESEIAQKILETVVRLEEDFADYVRILENTFQRKYNKEFI